MTDATVCTAYVKGATTGSPQWVVPCADLAALVQQPEPFSATIVYDDNATVLRVGPNGVVTA